MKHSGFKKLFKKSRKIAGINCTIKADGKMVWNLVIIKFANDQVEIENKVADIEDLVTLKSYLPTSVYIYMSITGKGILLKQKDKAGDEDIDFGMVDSLFPNVDPQDFFIQSAQTNDKVYFSIIRKEKIEEIVTSFNQQELFVEGICVGPLFLFSLLPLFDSMHKINTSSYIFNIDQQDISSIQTNYDETEEEYMIGNMKIESSFIPSFAVGLQYFGTAGVNNYDQDLIKYAANEAKNKRFFQQAIKIILAFFLIVLMLNAVAFMNASNKNSLLEQQVNNATQMLSKLDSLKATYQYKKDFVEKNGLQTSSSISYYADQLALSLPTEISWEELNIFPVDEKILEIKREMAFMGNKIIVKGSCSNPVILNQWIKKVEAMDWIQSIDDFNYQFDNRSDKGIFSFTLIL